MFSPLTPTPSQCRSSSILWRQFTAIIIHHPRRQLQTVILQGLKYTGVIEGLTSLGMEFSTSADTWRYRLVTAHSAAGWERMHITTAEGRSVHRTIRVPPRQYPAYCSTDCNGANHASAQKKVNISAWDHVTEEYPLDSNRRKRQQPLLSSSDRRGNRHAKSGTVTGEMLPLLELVRSGPRHETLFSLATLYGRVLLDMARNI